MSDQPPVEIHKSPTREAAEQTLRVMLLGAFAALADHFIHSPQALTAVLAAGACLAGFLATYLVGLAKFLRTHAQLRLLESVVPDSIARLKP